ncbi:MAG: hypothetical protein A3K09_04965 [Nitrospinae bacterium RIFCSPLOWO2_12_FULL_47_7]|nr:MAG: hypothetical protein A3K09_04965 [Nitrospinae bacterium RIFCSPLOWO2_12_FULL_47_7]
MTGHGIHVHGEHDHEVEHQAKSGSSLAQAVAIFTAIMATIGAVVSYQGSNTQITAMLLKNEAVLKKTEAANQWNYYQAKSSKGHLMELAVALVDEKKAEHYRSMIEKYNQEKKEIKAKAEDLEAKSAEANAASEQTMHPHHKLEQAMTLIQIAISLASITVLTRKKWLFVLAATSAAGGLVLCAMAFMIH